MFKKWLRKQILRAMNEPEEANLIVGTTCDHVRSTRLDYDHDGILNFRIFKARGGTVIEFSRYSRSRNSTTGSGPDLGVYVIPDEHDFTMELSKIITMENLKHF